MSYIATLCAGLRDTSRIANKLCKTKSLDTVLRIAQLDALRVLIWQNTKDGAKGRNRPKSLMDQINKKTEQKDKIVAFSSGDDFDRYRQSLMEK